MNVLIDKELNEGTWRAFAAGAAIALAFVAAISILAQWDDRHPKPIAAPSIVMQTSNQTVARIPTLRAGVRVDCTVTIDQANNVSSVAC